MSRKLRRYSTGIVFIAPAPGTGAQRVAAAVDRSQNYDAGRDTSAVAYAFDLSCAAPVLMLDINALLEGNVAESFVPYDHDVNQELFQVFCGRWGIDIYASSTIELMALFESFQCAP